MTSTKEDLEFTMFIKSMEELLDGFSSPALEEAADKVTDALRVLALKARQKAILTGENKLRKTTAVKNTRNR